MSATATNGMIMTSTMLIVLLAMAIAAVLLNHKPQPSASQARKVLRSFYVVQHDFSKTRQEAYLRKELRELGAIKEGRQYSLDELVAILEATAEVVSQRELERHGLKTLPDRLVHSRIQRWHRATRLPAWAVWSGCDPDADNYAERFRELARQHLAPPTPQRT